jgi:uncharacterized protein
MSLKDRITEDMKAAMRAKDSERLSTIRMLLAACKQREVDERIVLDDAAVVGHRRQADQAAQGLDRRLRAGRPHRPGGQGERRAAGAEAYLPQRLSAEEVAAEVAALVAELGAAGPGDMGKVMAAAKARLAGKAEMGQVSAAVKQAWQNDPTTHETHHEPTLPARSVASDVCVAPQLTPAAMAEAARAGFSSVVNNRPDFEHGPDQPTSASDRGRRARRRPGVPAPAGGRRLPVARADCRSPHCWTNCRGRCWPSAAPARARRACSRPPRPLTPPQGRQAARAARSAPARGMFRRPALPTARPNDGKVPGSGALPRIHAPETGGRCITRRRLL